LKDILKFTIADLDLQRTTIKVSDALCREAWNDFADRYARWMVQAPHPQLVSEVWLVSVPVSLKPVGPLSGSGNIFRSDKNSLNAPATPLPPASACFASFSGSPSLQAARFNPETARFETAEWPARLESLRKRYNEAVQQIGGLFTINRDLLTPVDEETLSIIIPIFRSPLFSRPGDHGRFLTTAPELGFTIIVLNRDYIKQEFIPALAGRYFSGGRADGDLDYNLLIVSRRDPKNHFYSSDPKAEKEVAASSVIEHRGITVSRPKILSEVWGFDIAPSTRSVDVYVAGLRRKIEPDPRHPKYLLTIHSLGYKFVG
jgi:Transcriptional regulatory protein, C terminal